MHAMNVRTLCVELRKDVFKHEDNIYQYLGE